MTDIPITANTTVIVPSRNSVHGGIAPAGVSTIITLGYYTEGDGGGARYVINTDGVVRPGDMLAAQGRRYQIDDALLDPRAFGAKADTITLNNAQMTSASATLNAPLGATGWGGFTQADVGKYVGVAGAGAAVAAWGWLRFTRNPSAADTITIGANTITWNTQVNVAGTNLLSAAALVTYINANTGTLLVTAAQDGADVKLTANTAGTSGNAIALATSTTFIESPRVEARGSFLWGGVANGTLTGTILSVTDSTHATLSVAASATVTNVRLDFGTDNTAAIQAAIDAASSLVASTRSNLLYAGRYPNDITRFGNFSAGVRTVVLVGDSVRARFGVLSPLNFSTGNRIVGLGASLAALPGFTGREVVGSDTGQDNVNCHFEDLIIECNGFADHGVWLRNMVWGYFKGRTYVHDARLSPMRLGYTGTGLAQDITVDALTYARPGIANGTVSTNDPASVGFWTESNATDCQVNNLEGEGYRTGVRREGASIHVKFAHVWGHNNTGPMNVGFDLRGDGTFGFAYADSPCVDPADPTNPTTAYAAVLRSVGRIEYLKVYENIGVIPYTSGDTTVVKNYNTGGTGDHDIGTIDVSTGNTSTGKIGAIVEYATTAAKMTLRVGTIQKMVSSVTNDNLWAANDLGTPWGPVYQSTVWFTPAEIINAVAGATSGANIIKLVPFRLRRPVLVDSLGIRMTTANGNAQCAIYAALKSSNLPTGTPVYSSGTLDVSSGTNKTFSSVSTYLAPGIYWFGINTDSASAAFMAVDNARFNGMVTLIGGDGTLNTGGEPTGFSIASTYNTWLDLTSKVRGDYTTISTAIAPAFQFKAG